MTWLMGLHLALLPKNILALFFGSGVGLFLGTLPGLGPAFALTLFVPLTFNLSAETALTFLVAMYTAAVFGGAITAILINVPGHPGNIATTFDGQPLARQGRAAEAIAAVGVAGTVGGLLGVLLLVSLAPVIVDVAVRVNPADYFMLAVFGLTMVAATAGKKMVEGLILGGLGFILSTVGQDPITGTYRFGFGSEYLHNYGVSFGVVVIGIFAIGSAFLMIEERRLSKAVVKPEKVKGDFKVGIMAVVKHPVEIIRAGLVGVVMGVIPGLGIAISNIAAYMVESKIKPNAGWGKGNIVGVMVPETADNATLMCELVPAFSLGIPGALTSALMLDAITVHGLQPGPQFFHGNPVTAEFFIAMFLSQIVFAVLGIVLAPFLAKAAYVPTTIIAPVIIVAGCVGAYAVNGTPGDIIVALIFGVVGYVIMKLKLPLAPLVLGALLGPLAENNYRRALIISHSNGHSSFLAPLPIILGVLIAGMMAFIVLEWRKGLKVGQGGSHQYM